jgi:maltose O-acetyltransferase
VKAAAVPGALGAISILGRLGLLPRAMQRRAFRKLLGPHRLAAWRRLGATIGDDVSIGPDVTMRLAANVSIGDGTSIGGRTWIDSWGPVRIGRNCLMSDRIDLLTAGHHLDSPTFDGDTRFIEIGDYVWMPMQIVVLPGVRIGNRAVIGTGSVVSRDVPENAVVAGNPARVVNERPVVDFRYVPGTRTFS